MSAYVRTRDLPRAIKSRIRELVADEIRSRLSDAGAAYVEHESAEVIAAWADYTWVIADQISPEGRR